jgi:hypothetical protein
MKTEGAAEPDVTIKTSNRRFRRDRSLTTRQPDHRLRSECAPGNATLMLVAAAFPHRSAKQCGGVLRSYRQCEK